MTFERPWIVLLALAPLAWAAFSWRGASRRGALVLKALGLAAVLLALAEPQLGVFESKMAVAILADTSSSVSPQDLQRQSELAGVLEAARGRNWTQVMPFAESTRRVDTAEREKGWKLGYTAGQPGRGTDIEAALRKESPRCRQTAFRAWC